MDWKQKSFSKSFLELAILGIFYVDVLKLNSFF